jgi:hypothetical protein
MFAVRASVVRYTRPNEKGKLHMNTTPAQPRRGHTGTWILALFALLELAALIALVAFREQACTDIGLGQSGGSGTMVRIGGGGGGAGSGGGPGGSNGAGSPPPSALPSISPLPGGEAGQGGATPGNVKVQVDQSPIPDSNCEFKAAAGAFDTSPAPSARPSCAPASPLPVKTP